MSDYSLIHITTYHSNINVTLRYSVCYISLCVNKVIINDTNQTSIIKRVLQHCQKWKLTLIVTEIFVDDI